MRSGLLMRACLLLMLIGSPPLQAAEPPCTALRVEACGQGGNDVVAAAAAPDAGARHVSAVADKRYLFWKIAAPGSTLYLFGSIHFGEAGMYPLPAAVVAAFAAADALVVETNIAALEPAEVARAVAAKAMYQDGSTLDKKLAPETWQRLSKIAEDLGLPPPLLLGQRPWFASMTVTALAMRRYGYSEALGIDNHFLEAVQHQQVIELESFAQQLAFFDGFSDSEQEAMLRQTLDDVARGPEFIRDTVSALRAGQDERLDRLLNDEFRGDDTAARMYRVLIVDRNAAMADKLAGLMQRGGNYFVVVGAAHLVGDQGIVSLLRSKGYRPGRS